MVLPVQKTIETPQLQVVQILMCRRGEDRVSSVVGRPR